MRAFALAEGRSNTKCRKKVLKPPAFDYCSQEFADRGLGGGGMFALVVLGFLVAYLLILRGMRKPAIALALVLQLACLGLYFSHSYHVNWPW